MSVRVFRFLSLVAIVLLALLMCYPQRVVDGVDLGDPHLQGTAFALCMLLRALSRGGSLRSDPYFGYRSGVWEAGIATIRRNVVRLAIEMLVLAALLEFGQWLLPKRHGTFGDFFLNSLGVIAAGMVAYVLVALALRTAPGRRITQYFTTLD